MSLDNGDTFVTTLIPWKKRVSTLMLQLIEMKKHMPKTSTNQVRKLVKADFIYDKENDRFTCPHGQILPFKKLNYRRTTHLSITAKTCANCPYHKRCGHTKKGEARVIVV